jgi:copper chaperone
MKKIKFKTNINCGGCIAGIAPFLDENKEISTWRVDISDPRRILTIETGSSAELILKVIQTAGFKAEEIF